MDPSKKLLVLGGTSSLAEGILRLALQEEYSVTATYRTESKIFNHSGIVWLPLDISKINEIEEFLDSLTNERFGKIIYLIGETSKGMNGPLLPHKIFAFLQTYLLNSCFLIKSLSRYIYDEQSSNFTYMSSRSALYGSYDWLYGISKAGLQNLITSLDNLDSTPGRFISVAPGLIRGSNMENEMDLDTRKKHSDAAKTSGQELLTVSQLATEVWQISSKFKGSAKSGVIEVGPVY